MAQGKARLNYNEMTNDEILQVFKEQYYKLKPKNAIEFFKDANSPTQHILKSKLNMTYAQTLVRIGVRNTERKRYKKDKEHMQKYYTKYKNKIYKIYNELGYIPNTNEIIKYGIRPCSINSVLGITYYDFITEIGLEHEMKTHYGQYNNVSDEELLNIYKAFCLQLGRVATRFDIEQSKNMPCIGIFQFRFGSFNEVKRLSKVDELALDKRIYSKNYIMQNLKQIYVDNSKRVSLKELEICIDNYFDRGISISTILYYFKTTNINDVWNEVEQSLLKDYIKLLKKKNK
ncbi:hypothetical protein SAMN02745248_00602 [Hathewaya proteolytica DSM 3090]|uniref:Uncharacterized protein n=1 Tax=Hathewaya proteolytica DSM 3090 TaxID=1121331 RepID=A0A1M6L302_9CLOT|nr:hypothetical protein [Hathewaya proteolytica]SHJ65542.1 hypothetical protein SAMN02745248_00602 [Hathewaya proteolytica DSM 3090]